MVDVRLRNVQNYLQLLKYVLENGEQRKDRTGVGTIGIFGAQLRFDLRKSFPILTIKLINIKAVIYELLWFISHQIKNDPFIRRHIVCAILENLII